MEVERIPSKPPIILPITDGNFRPLWSVMIPVYNCAVYLKETLKSVLLQDMGEEVMQIEVIDDASTDANVREIVEEIGKGRVKYFRQPVNVGSLRNFETCINRARGKLVHLLHGDDTVESGYYHKITELFQKFPEAGAAFCKNTYIDDKGKLIAIEESLLQADGILPNWLNLIAERQRLQYVAITVKREVYESLGSFYGVTYGEDWEMWVRIASQYPTAYSPELLANYRLHFSSISGNTYKKGQNIRDLSKVIKLISPHLLESDRKRISCLSTKRTAYNALDFTSFIWAKTRSRKIVVRQVFEVLRLYRDRHLIKKSCLLIYKTFR